MCLCLMEEIRSVSNARLYQIGLQERNKCGAIKVQWRGSQLVAVEEKHLMEKWHFWLTPRNGFCQVCEGHLDKKSSMSQRSGKCRRSCEVWLEYRANGRKWVQGQQGPYRKYRSRWPQGRPWLLAWEIYTYCINSSKIFRIGPRIFLILKREFQTTWLKILYLCIISLLSKSYLLFFFLSRTAPSPQLGAIGIRKPHTYKLCFLHIPSLPWNNHLENCQIIQLCSNWWWLLSPFAPKNLFLASFFLSNIC